MKNNTHFQFDSNWEINQVRMSNPETTIMNVKEYIAEGVRSFFSSAQTQLLMSASSGSQTQILSHSSSVLNMNMPFKIEDLCLMLPENLTQKISKSSEPIEEEGVKDETLENGMINSKEVEDQFVGCENVEMDCDEEFVKESSWDCRKVTIEEFEPVVDNVWFFNAVKKYKDLYQWETGTNVLQIDKMKEQEMWFLTMKRGHNSSHDLCHATLPLTSDDVSSCVISRDELSLSEAVESKQKIYKMKAVPHMNILLASKEDRTGIAVYKVKDDKSSEQLSMCGYIQSNYKSANFTYHGNNLVLADSGPKPVILYDLQTGNEKMSIKFPNGEGPMKPFFVAPTLVAVCYVKWGTYGICDIRDNKPKILSFSDETKSTFSEEIWIPSSSFEHSISVSNSMPLYVGLLSVRGTLLLYDLRRDSTTFRKNYLNKLAITKNHHSPGIYMKFCPTDPNKFSVSGFDERVTIYEIPSSGNVKPVFDHTGHYNQADCSFICTTTDHFWMDSDCLVSAADNGSLQMWKYVTAPQNFDE